MLNFTLFTRDLLEQIIPLVERSYRVYADADHRAIGGLSMGAFQSIEIGLAHPELFRYVLAYSGGFGALGPRAASFARRRPQSPWKELLANPADIEEGTSNCCSSVPVSAETGHARHRGSGSCVVLQEQRNQRTLVRLSRVAMCSASGGTCCTSPRPLLFKSR